ncbi:MAG: hypothetical protein FWF55_08680 [Treponema sp.]|nr:hypothetical protein [Treponema sp.]
MHRHFFIWAMYFFLSLPAGAESIRTLVMGDIELSSENAEGGAVKLSYNGSALIRLGRGARYFRGIELELTAPQSWLMQRGSLAMETYAELDRVPAAGANDLEARRIAFDPLPSKIKIIYQIPVRPAHGLRTTPYATVTANTALPASFPLLFRLLPIVKGLSDELENMSFTLTARPILGDEGAVRLAFRYPAQLRDKPFTVLVDDVVVANPAEELLIKEGEHHLVVLSDDYRNESRRFMVERAKRVDVTLDLQDPTPLIIFEAPENARIFLNNNLVRESGPIAVEPGVYEARFQVGDYTLTKTITAQRGKTYRVSLSVGIDVEEDL